MTPAELKTAISAALTGQIGVYTFGAGQTTPAIRIDDGAEPYPEEPEVTGLEVVIRPEANIAQSMRLAGDRTQQRFHEIILKQWNVDATTKAARDALMLALDIDGNVPVVPRSTTLDTIETCTLTIEA